MLSNRRRRGANSEHSVGGGCGEGFGEGRRGLVSERGVWPCVVEIVSPFGDDAACMIDAEEEALIQQFIPHTTVEGVDVTVLHRLAGRDVVPFDPVI